jgi:hypothetical protein
MRFLQDQRVPSEAQRSIRLPARQVFAPPYQYPHYSIVLGDWLLDIARRSHERKTLTGGLLVPERINPNDVLCQVALDIKVL